MDNPTQAVQPDTQVEGFWFITSLIVVILIVMVIGIILFLVYVFTGDVFTTTCTTNGATTNDVPSNDIPSTSSNPELQKPKEEEVLVREISVKDPRKQECANHRRLNLGLGPVPEFDVITNTLSATEMNALLDTEVPKTDLPDPLFTEALRTAALPLFEETPGLTGLILANGKQFLKINNASINENSIQFEYTYIAVQKQSLVPRIKSSNKIIWQGSSFDIFQGNSQIKSLTLPKMDIKEKVRFELLHMPSEKVMASTFVGCPLSNNNNIVSNTASLSPL